MGSVLSLVLQILANGGGKRQTLANAIAAAAVMYITKRSYKVSGDARNIDGSCGDCMPFSCSVWFGSESCSQTRELVGCFSASETGHRTPRMRLHPQRGANRPSRKQLRQSTTQSGPRGVQFCCHTSLIAYGITPSVEKTRHVPREGGL